MVLVVQVLRQCTLKLANSPGSILIFILIFVMIIFQSSLNMTLKLVRSSDPDDGHRLVTFIFG